MGSQGGQRLANNKFLPAKARFTSTSSLIMKFAVSMLLLLLSAISDVMSLEEGNSTVAEIDKSKMIVDELDTLLDSLYQAISDNRDMILALQNETVKLADVQNKMRTSIAFTAYNPDILTLAKEETMKFPDVTLNEGGAYDGDSVFTAPMSGLYQLSVNTICNSQNEDGQQQANLRLECDGVTVFNLYSKCQSDQSIRVPASNAAAVHLAEGAECSVITEKGSGIARAGMSSIFSGHVLLLD